MTAFPPENPHAPAWRIDAQRLGLDLAVIERHAALIKSATQQRAKPCFKIVDTCRIDNGGILGAEDGARIAGGVAGERGGYVAFVPAAGAASRYSQPLARLVAALEEDADDSQRDLSPLLGELKAEGGSKWPLPAAVHRLLEDPELGKQLTPNERRQLLLDLQLPKAMMPCVKEGDSFLALKVREHAHLPELVGQVFVAPSGMSDTFAAEARRIATGETAGFLEQGPELSTIRFNPDGNPYTDEEGRLSPVPAGHGALAELFPDAGRKAPAAHSLFIRNIDNVMGSGHDARAATSAFLATHAAILGTVRAIRKALSVNDVDSAQSFACEMIAAMPDARPSKQPLADLLGRLFHARLPEQSDERSQLALLVTLFARPVNTLGQVPNTGSDVGGTPCFVSVGKVTEKICIEVPHVSEDDKRLFLANAAKATHFNPVFVAAEIPARRDYYTSANQDFWLLSEKTFKGRPVLYVETVLYELLGNSRLANAAFLEVPRLVFHPHKALKDAASRSLSEWLD